MKKNDYRNHLDGIKCSAEFRAEMEKKLSSEPDGEYTDSVSDIEYAPKVNYHRWSALVASALIIVGIGGLAFLGRGNIETQIESNVSSESTDVPTSKYNIGISVSYKDRMISLGALPPELTERYINEMKSWSDFRLDSVPQLISEPTGAIVLSFTGEDSFTWKIDSNGYAVTKHNGEQTEAYYSDICYRALTDWIARDMLYLDWTCIVEGDRGITLDKAFDNHADEIEHTDSVGDMTNSIRFFDCGNYSGTINQAGDIVISYTENSDYFRSSFELYQEIYNAVQDDLINRIEKSENMFYASTGGKEPYYNVNFGKIDYSLLCDEIKSTVWTVTEGEFPTGEFFNIGNYVYITKECIYDAENHVIFTANNRDFSAFKATENTIPGDISYIAYLIASADSRFDTISGEISYSNSEYISGSGSFFYNNKHNDEYISIADANTSAELNMNGYYWKLETRKEDETEVTEGSSNSMPIIEYTSIKKDLLYYLDRVICGENTNVFEDKTSVNYCNITADGNSYGFTFDIEYHQYHVTVDATIDKIGNIIYLNIYEENKQYPDNAPKIISFNFTEDIIYDELTN